MKRIILVIFFSWASAAALAKDIAICGASSGLSYFPLAGLTKDDGDADKWVRDGISTGRLTLVLLPEDKVDMLFSDATGSVISATQDGARVQIDARAAR
jgi:hypothetical protein